MPSFVEKLDNCLVRYLAYFNYKDYVNRLNLQGNERILELGCGGGNLSRFLAEKIPSGKLICIDNSGYWINKARRRLKNFGNIEFKINDILNFDEETYFDVAIVHYVLHDIIKRGNSIHILNKYLNPRGKICVREPIKKSHGMSSTEIERLMFLAELKKLSSEEGYFFPIRGRVYEGMFVKCLK